ncbi:MAG: hypothetical protein ACREJV_06955 [Candidatus Rokuibacteriota bacterium]
MCFKALEKSAAGDLGVACDVARRALPAASHTLGRLRDRLWEHLHAGLGDGSSSTGIPSAGSPTP